MKFTLRRPCAKCPFRTDVPPYLQPERAQEIVDAMIRRDQTFTCHETTVPADEDDDDDCGMVDGPNAQHCAGALILLEKIGRPNQMMRIMERLRGYDASKLDMDAPVFATPREFVKAQRRPRRPRP